MRNSSRLSRLESYIVRDPRLLSTLASYVLILVIWANLSSLRSPAIGIGASFSFFLIDGIFLANAFFQKNSVFVRLTFGVLLLVMLLGFVGWLIMIIYNLGVPLFTLTLSIVATVSSLLNRRVKYRNAT